MNALRWILAIILSSLFLIMASFKFSPEVFGVANPVFPVIEQNTDLGFIDPYFRWITGALEIIAGLLIIIPRTRYAGAALAVCILIGAIGTHLTVLGISVPGEGPFLFFLAIGMLVLSALVMVLAWRVVPYVRVAN